MPIEWVIYKPAEIFGGLKNEGIETLISDVLTKKRVIFPAGNEKMYPISLEDTARVIREELFMPEAAGKTQILNGPEGFTYQEAIHLVMNLTHREVRGIGIPRFLMLLIKYMLRLLPLHVGIVPDQIDRFYASKPHVFRSDIQDRLGDYILQVQQRSS